MYKRQIVYGNGASESNSAYEGNINETGSVTLRSGAVDANGVLNGSGNNGKLVPASFDGLNFYYTSVSYTHLLQPLPCL